jgi:hypothetical protein
MPDFTPSATTWLATTMKRLVGSGVKCTGLRPPVVTRLRKVNWPDAGSIRNALASLPSPWTV